MIYNHDEKTYSEIYMQEVFGKAGVERKFVIGLVLIKSPDEKFLDDEGRVIQTVWKMWNWETVSAAIQLLVMVIQLD